MKKVKKISKKAVIDKEDSALLINSTFLDKNGKKIKVKDVVNKDDCWFLNKANAWILTHQAIKTIARIAGISINYDVEESANIIPNYANELEHIVRVTIHCSAKNKSTTGTGCIHSDESKLTITGEANRINTPHRGRGFLRKMAEKRAYDIAVLEHLGLYTTAFSEEEAKDFNNKTEKEPVLMPGSQEFERIVVEINAILNATTLPELKKVGHKIKAGIKINKYTDIQLKYLRDLYEREYGRKATEF